MKKAIIALLSLGLFAIPAFAKNHCTCTEECQKQCAKGETSDCDCKSCNCKDGKGCSHGQCKR